MGGRRGGERSFGATADVLEAAIRLAWVNREWYLTEELSGSGFGVIWLIESRRPLAAEAFRK